jgi:hypothetical protein
LFLPFLSKQVTTDKFPYPTTYDIIKTLAVITMIIDHVGLYFAGDNPWLRAIGRIGLPVWFYLIGYARSRQLGTKLIGGASILVATNLFVGFLVIPLNALWSVIFIRLSLNRIIRLIGKSEIILSIVLLAFMFLNPFLDFLWEYGGLAFIFALCGYYQRNGFADKKFVPAGIAVFSLVAFIYSQQQLFNLPLAPLLFMIVGTIATMLILVYYLPKDGPAISSNNRFITKSLMIGGHYTLEIYVIHLTVFKAIYFALHGCSGSVCILH